MNEELNNCMNAGCACPDCQDHLKKECNELYILEYSDEQRSFHFNFGDHNEYSSGWETLGKHNWDECASFSTYMRGKYAEELPNLYTVQKEYS